MSFSLIHVIVIIKISFFKTNITYHMFLFIYLSIDRYQNLSCILVIANSMAIKHGTLVSFDTNLVALDYKLHSGIAES